MNNNWNVDNGTGDNVAQGLTEKQARERAHEAAYRDGLAACIYQDGSDDTKAIDPLTDDVIDAIMIDAGEAGDTGTVELCRSAKENGDGASLATIAGLIADAAAMAD